LNCLKLLSDVNLMKLLYTKLLQLI
jgi:hypothetical protein